MQSVNCQHGFVKLLSFCPFWYTWPLLATVGCTVIGVIQINRVFPKLTDLTFLSFLYKIDITGFQNQQKKIAFTGYWTHNTNPTIKIPATLTTQPPRHLLNRISLNWTWIISGSIEHDFKRAWKFETGMDWQIGWVGKVAGILIVGLVLWVQYPVEVIFFLLILKPRDVNFVQEWQKCQICQFRKNSNEHHVMLKFQVGPNRDALFPEHTFFCMTIYGPMWKCSVLV